MPQFVQFITYSWGSPASLPALSPSLLTNHVNEALGAIQKEGGRVLSVDPFYLIEHAGVALMVTYERESPISL